MTVSPKQAAVLLGGDVSGDSVLAPGPGHSKHDRSLSVRFSADAPEGFVVHSFAGDDALECRDYVKGKLGIAEYRPSERVRERASKPSTSAKPAKDRGPKKLVATYEYLTADAEPWGMVRRFEYEDGGKTFSQFHWNGIDGYDYGKPATNWPIPYGLPAIVSNPDATIYLVEGEKCVQALQRVGLLATTAAGGVNALPADASHPFWGWLDGSRVVALPDNDAPGREWTARVKACLPDAIVVQLPVENGEDVADWLDNGGTVAELERLSSDDFLHESETETPDAEPAPRVLPTPYRWTDPASIKPREWLYGSHLIRRYVSTTISPGGLGKSSMVMVEALSMVSGKSLLGERVHPAEPLRVWYWNGEDPNDEGARRIQAAAIEHKLTPDDIGDRLFMDSGRDMRITLAKMTRGEIELDEGLFDEIETALRDRNIDVWSLDPFVSTHQVSENDNGAIDAIIKRLGIVAERANCAIELVHHVRKPSGGDTGKTDVNDARGASALIGGVRSARVLNAMSAQEAEDYGIENRFSFFRVDNGKSNLAPRSNETKWRRIVSVDLENGPTLEESDHIGVVIPWSPPANTSTVPDDAVMVAQRIAYEYPELARADTKSGDWLGHALGRELGIDSVDPKGKRDLERALRDWHKSGALVQEIRPDASRKPRQYFACPESERPLNVSVERGDISVVDNERDLF